MSGRAAFVLDLESIAAEDEGLEDSVGEDFPFVVPEHPTQRQIDNDEDPGTRELILYAPSHSMLMLTVTLLNSESNAKTITETIDLFMHLLDEDDAKYVKARMYDRTDPFGAGAIAKALAAAVEGWGGARPTRPSRSGTKSQQSAGSRSTAKRRHVERPARSAAVQSDS